jgi:multimeric flavodoxin WrbA
MKVLGIYGSPRKGGNSDLLLDEALKGAQEAGAQVERIFCRKLKMAGCIECGGCAKTGQCVVEDDMQQVYPLLDQAEAVILAVPMFFYSAPAIAKTLIDRAQACWSRRMLQKTREQRKTYDGGKGYLIAVGATKGENLFLGVELMAKYFYDALDKSYEGGVMFRGVDDKGAIENHPDYLKKAYDLGRGIVEKAKA